MVVEKVMFTIFEVRVSKSSWNSLPIDQLVLA